MTLSIDIYDGKTGWELAEALDREIYPPEVMAAVVWRDVTWAHADWRILVRLRDDVVCHVGLYLRQGRDGECEVRIGGIGGVMTSARARRRGCASRAMQAAAAKMRDEDCDFGLLFCETHNVGFYAGLGWEIFDGEVYCEQPAGRFKFDMMHTMIWPVRGVPQSGVIDLCGLPW